MFTGIVEAVGTLAEVKPIGGRLRVRIATPLAAELAAGDSLAVNGVCLTVILIDGGEVHADVGPETARVTTLGRCSAGSASISNAPCRSAAGWAATWSWATWTASAPWSDVRPDAGQPLADGRLSAETLARVFHPQRVGRRRRRQPDRRRPGRRRSSTSRSCRSPGARRR